MHVIDRYQVSVRQLPWQYRSMDSVGRDSIAAMSPDEPTAAPRQTSRVCPWGDLFSGVGVVFSRRMRNALSSMIGGWLPSTSRRRSALWNSGGVILIISYFFHSAVFTIKRSHLYRLPLLLGWLA